MIPILIGLGVNELSMSPGSMPLAKKLVRQLSMNECAELVEKALLCDTSADVLRLSQELLRLRAPELTDI